MYNICLHYKYFPSYWKMGKIKLLNKAGKDPARTNNYKPIALLPVLGKIFEKIIKQLLEAEMICRDVLHQNQYAFRKGRSTENAAGFVLEGIEKMQKRYRHVIVLSFDVSPEPLIRSFGLLLSEL